MDPLKSNEGLHLKNQMEKDMLYGQISCFVLHLLPIIAIHNILGQIVKKLQFSKKRLPLYASAYVIRVCASTIFTNANLPS